jgi:hypothetical protein
MSELLWLAQERVTMKLSELKSLHEGRVDPNVVLSIDNVIRNQKLTNHFETIVLARLLEFFKNGEFYKSSNFFDPFVSTSKELLDVIRNLETSDLVALATKLRELIEVKDKDELAAYANTTQEAIAWVQWATKREATD